MSQTDSLLFLKKKLENTILQLESDQVLQQMRNDHSLAQFKRQHIKQLIREEMDLQTDVQNIIAENNELKDQIYQKEDLIAQIRQEYTSQIENIDRDWERYRNKTESDKKKQDEQHQKELYVLREECRSKTQQNQTLKNVLEKLKNENDLLKEERQKAEQNKLNLQQALIRMKAQLQQKSREISSKNIELQQTNEVQIQIYQQTIQKMKQDMQYIRECWEKKCQTIETELQEENNMLVLHYEEKMRKELKEHAQNLKLGNSVIITDSEQIIAKRMEKIQQEYSQEMRRVEQELHGLEKVYIATKQQFQEKEKIIKQLQNKVVQIEKERSKDIYGKQQKIDSLSLEISSVKQYYNKAQSDIKECRSKIQELSRQKENLRDQILVWKKRESQKVAEIEQIQSQVESYKNKINKLSNCIDEANQQMQSHKKIILNKEQALHQKQHQIQTIKRQKSAIQTTVQSLKTHNQKNSLVVKQQKDKIKRMVVLMDKMHVLLRKSRKDNQILREQVRCNFQILKTKFAVEMEQIVDYIVRSKEQSQRRHKQKMNELLDQMEIKERQLIQNLASEKQQIKSELEQSEESMQKKISQVEKYKATLKDSEQQKKHLIQDLQKEKLSVTKLQQKIESNNISYENTISRLQKDIGRSLTHFYNKWSDKISQLEGQLQTKENKIRTCVQKMDQLIRQIEQNKRRAEWAQQEVKKYRKKYDQVRKERDSKIESLLKQLEQEARHRLNLERELKEVRLSIMRGNNNNINFSFNDKEKDYNAVTNYKYTGVTSKEKDDFNEEREKQLSELREMIVKTYKMVGDTPAPQRDIGRNLSKKNLF